MKRFVVILILTANVFANNQPVILAARTVVRKGKLEFGVRNNTRSNISGVIKFEKTDGVELLASGFGFNLGPKKTAYRSIPIRNTTKDLPFLTCDVVIFNNAKSKLYKNKIQCKSGALFRDIGVNETVAKFTAPKKVQIHTNGESLLNLSVNKKCVIDNLFFKFDDLEIKWRKTNSKSGEKFIGMAFDGSNAVADLKLSVDLNGRGDCNVVLSYSLINFMDDLTEAPGIIVDIPREIAKDDLITIKNNDKTDLFTIDNMTKNINSNVDEFSVITKNDWMTFYMDGSYLNVWSILPKTTPDKHAGSIRLVIKSRTDWKPPFVPKRSGTIQFFIHLPVDVPR